MSVNVPGAAPPGPADEVFGGGFWDGFFGLVQPVLNSIQSHELNKINAKAAANALAAPASYNQVPAGYQTTAAPVSALGIGGLTPETLLMIGGGVLLAIFLLRK
ncbi:hypothetical protein [Parvibaculum sp.]|uniref:hypothetical protein n=1 Tax=Parvibaculum sp. TaxID=2024848 RepID=UPI00260B3A4D|nr:hypothetical protein [Parvibaculum sp.]MCW5728149.1 hypothetical protein [Parvibaculum sp.]